MQMTKLEDGRSFRASLGLPEEVQRVAVPEIALLGAVTPEGLRLICIRTRHCCERI